MLLPGSASVKSPQAQRYIFKTYGKKYLPNSCRHMSHCLRTRLLPSLLVIAWNPLSVKAPYYLSTIFSNSIYCSKTFHKDFSTQTIVSFSILSSVPSVVEFEIFTNQNQVLISGTGSNVKSWYPFWWRSFFLMKRKLWCPHEIRGKKFNQLPPAPLLRPH